MQPDRFQRYLPLSGTLAGLVLAAGILITKDEPSGDNPTVQAVAGWYKAHQTAEMIASMGCIPLFALLLLFFGASLRGTLRSREVSDATCSTVVAGAAPLVALSILLMSSIDMATTVAANNGEGDVARTIYLAGQFSWLPWAAPAGALLLATGIGALRTGALPRLHGWVSVLFGVVAVTPVGFVTFLVLPLWLIGSGIVLYRRQTVGVRVGAAVPALS